LRSHSDLQLAGDIPPAGREFFTLLRPVSKASGFCNVRFYGIVVAERIEINGLSKCGVNNIPPS
jgi:hypothetical protein